MMGEIADMMLDGTLCEGCGSHIEGEGQGFPRYCSPRCASDRGAEYYAGASYRCRTKRKGKGPSKTASPRARFKCPNCGKPFRSEHAVRDHSRDVHPTRTGSE